MANIFIADTPEGVADLERILGKRHQLTVVSKMRAAEAALEQGTFDLIIIGVHFDESRMFDLLPKVKASANNADKPIICFCGRDTEMTRYMHDSLEFSSKKLGAWMYLDQHLYNVVQNSDAELRRVIQRSLTKQMRKDTQKARVDIQKAREEIQLLRSNLLSDEWSLELEDRLGDLRLKLASVLLDLSKLHVDNIAQLEEIAQSRNLKDRVSDTVFNDENKESQVERTQRLTEVGQLVKEQNIVAEEEEIGKKGRQKLTDERLRKVGV